MKAKKQTITGIICAIILSTSAIQAQNNQTLTPPPPKTPTPSSTPTTQPIPENTVTPTTEALTQDDLLIITGNTQRPNGMVWYKDKLYTVCSGDWTVYEINPTTGETDPYLYGIRNAHTLYATTENDELHLWIPDFGSNNLTLINRGTTRIITTELNGPWGITQLDSEQFIITNLLENNTVTVNRDGTTREVITNLRSPTGIATDSDHIYIANTGSSRRAIEWLELDTVLNSETPIDSEDRTTTFPLVTGLQNTTNLILGQDRMLYFAYALGTRGIVGRINPEICINQGGCTHDQVEIIIFTQLNAPLAGLTISDNNHLFVHTIFSPDIYWVQLPNATP